MKEASQRVREAVAAALPVEYGGITNWEGPRHGDWSWMFEAETGGPGPATLLVKVPRWEEAPDLVTALAAGPQADTGDEFRALEAISAAVAAAGDPGLTAVVPVAYVPEVNAIVTERLRARPLHERIRRLPRSDSAALFRRAGRWLKAFHSIAGHALVPFGPAEAEDIERIAGTPGRSSALARAAEAVAATARALADRPVATGVLHGDFSMRNVLVTIDNRVAVVDPNRYRGRNTRDAAHLLTEARLGRRQLATSGVMQRRARVEEWADAMRDGYPDLDPVVLSYERAAAAIRKWEELENRLRGLSRLTLVPARRLFSSEVEALVGGI